MSPVFIWTKNMNPLPILLYVTAPSLEVAEGLGSELVTKKLAACVNLLPQMTSIYQWEGKVEQSQEVVLLVKTTEAVASAARELILKSHPYDCPCIISLPVETTTSHEPFLEWITQSVKI